MHRDGMGHDLPPAAEDAIRMMQMTDAPFSAIERFIDELAVSEERRASLWLLAWSEREIARYPR